MRKDKFQTITHFFIIPQEANYHKSKCNYEFFKLKKYFHKVYMGKQNLEFGEGKFLKLQKIPLSMLGEAKPWVWGIRVINTQKLSLKYSLRSKTLSLEKESFLDSKKTHLIYLVKQFLEFEGRKGSQIQRRFLASILGEAIFWILGRKGS